jgi:hypothetical protein
MRQIIRFILSCKYLFLHTKCAGVIWESEQKGLGEGDGGDPSNEKCFNM